MQNPTATRGSICGEAAATRDQPRDSGQMAKGVLVGPPFYRAENRPVPGCRQWNRKPPSWLSASTLCCRWTLPLCAPNYHSQANPFFVASLSEAACHQSAARSRRH